MHVNSDICYCYLLNINVNMHTTCHARRIPVRPDWRVRTEVRGTRLSILYLYLYCTGTLIDLFFLRAVHVPIGAQTISVITKIICTYTKELPSEWCPSQFIHIYKVSFTYTFKMTYYKNIRDCESSAGEHLSLSWPALLMWNVLSFSIVFCFCTYTD